MVYKFLSHTADIKIEVIADTLEKTFTEAALATTKSIAPNIKIKPNIKKQISLSGQDLKSLLYEFLEELLYLLDAKDFLLSNIQKIKINQKQFSLTAILIGDKASKYKFVNEVKAITYSEMIVEKLKHQKGYKLQFVLDV